MILLIVSSFISLSLSNIWETSGGGGGASAPSIRRSLK